uniref:Sex-determining region Y protein n=1 Tax=Bursaphelenchus xylophilus TaxID=6326 RepID=A0A1I7STW3_BURXY
MNESHISAADGTMPGSPMTETGSSTHEPTDFSGLKEEEGGIELDEEIEVHPQHSILAGNDASRQFIKRPLNAYMIWTRHARDDILKKNPHLKMNEVSKTMGEMWKKLPDDDKKPFFLMARKAAAKHKKALELNPKLAYVPSKKKHKKIDKKEEEHKEEKSEQSPYPTPSASPITNGTRPLHQNVVENTRPGPYPQPATIVRTPNTHYQQPPYSQPYEYRQPVQNGVYQYPPQQYTQQSQVRYVQHNYGYQNGNGIPANYPTNAYYPAQPQGHIIPNPRDPSQNLVRNPFAISYSDPPEPVYEPESVELYRELYYRSLVQLQFPSKQTGEPECLSPEFYLQRYYSLGGTDPPRRVAPMKSNTNNSNGLVYQEL